MVGHRACTRRSNCGTWPPRSPLLLHAGGDSREWPPASRSFMRAEAARSVAAAAAGRARSRSHGCLASFPAGHAAGWRTSKRAQGLMTILLEFEKHPVNWEQPTARSAAAAGRASAHRFMRHQSPPCTGAKSTTITIFVIGQRSALGYPSPTSWRRLQARSAS